MLHDKLNTIHPCKVWYIIIDALVSNFGELSADLEKDILTAVRRINEVYKLISICVDKY